MQRIVILGTGGTIAGTAADPSDNVGYTAGQRSVTQLLTALPMLAGEPIEVEQLAQLDSKDMDHATWQRLAQAVHRHLLRAEVQGVVITHGTDTLEETAWFLQRVLAPSKPVVFTAAMRPATALAADGPQNLLDAVTVARHPGARGVLAVMAGRVQAGAELRKRHTYRLDAFEGGDRGPLAVVEEGRLRVFRPWPNGTALGLQHVAAPVEDWPWVAVVASHAGVKPEQVRALVQAGVRGLVVAGTGNGTVHEALVPALEEARNAGVTVWRCSRCADGVLLGSEAEASPAAALSPWQARAGLMLALMLDAVD